MPRRSTVFNLAFDTWAANLEAQQVIALRLAKIGRGGAAAQSEMRQMVSEKTSTAMQVNSAAAVSMMTGGGAGVPSRALATYRRKMQANRRRLLRELIP